MIQPALAADRKDSLPVVQRVPVVVMPVLHLSLKEDLVVRRPLLRRQRRLQLRAVHAHQPSHAELDEVAVQEKRLEVVEIPRVGLQHGHAAARRLVVAFVEMLRFQPMRDLRVVERKCAERGRECIFVAPARAALGDESVKVLGAVVIVIGAEAESLMQPVSSVPSRGRCDLPSNAVSYPTAFDPNRPC